jgi:hypothetical protein
MICVTIVDQGKFLAPRDLTSPAQLRAAVDQARTIIAECEKLLEPKSAKTADARQSGGTPYLS